jgi:hypothetical protein
MVIYKSNCSTHKFPDSKSSSMFDYQNQERVLCYLNYILLDLDIS